MKYRMQLDILFGAQYADSHLKFVDFDPKPIPKQALKWVNLQPQITFAGSLILNIIPMDIDKIIDTLNSRDNISDICSGNYQDIILSDIEQAFMEKYSPEKSLIIYGTLAPNAPNHSVVEHIKGNWLKGIIRGRLTKEGWGAELGYYGFSHTNNKKDQAEIKVFILFSDELYMNWEFLDNFEGNGYKRILSKYELENGQLGVGNIYAVNTRLPANVV